MLDTVELRCEGDPAGQHAAFIAELTNPTYTDKTLPDGTHSRTYAGDHRLFDRVRCNEVGTVTIAGSLPRLAHALGKAGEKKEGNPKAGQAQAWYDLLQAAIWEHVPWATQVTLTRFDLAYDRTVPDPGAIILAAAAILTPTRKGKAAYSNGADLPEGLMLRGNLVAHRLYDKHQESPTLYPPGTLRSEEQLRRHAAAFKAIYDETTGRFNREAAVKVMRERYRACTELVVATPSLLTAADTTAYLYATRPDLRPQIDAIYSRAQRYRVHERSRNIMGQTMIDLRPPANAWM